MKSYRSKISVLLFLLPVLFVALFYACGGDDKITVTVSPKTGSAISATDKIVVTFSGPVDPATLELGGNLASASDGGAWTSSNKVLTITPTTSWDTAVSAATLTVDVKDTGGTALTTIELAYTVTIKLTTFQVADVVIGQVDFVSNSIGTTAGTLNYPYANPGYYEGKLFLPDYSNNRVIVYNAIPATNGKAANYVVGQTNLTSSVAGTAANQIAGPVSVQAYKDKLFVLEYDNNRMVIYNTVPTASNATANVVIGQTAFGMNATNCGAVGLDRPESFMIADDKLIIADSGNNRVLIWNSIPTTNGQVPDLVLGQNSFTTCANNDDNQDGTNDANPSQRTLDFPTGVWSDGTKLVIGDESNNRLLIWNTFPTTKFKKADLVLGQADFTHNAYNDDNQDGVSDATASARTLNDPYVGIASNGKQLFVTDSSNNRLLIWSTFPTTSFAKADLVVGQSNFAHYQYDDANQDDAFDATPSAKTFDYPAGLLLIGNQLIVTDESNQRYLIFNGQ